VVTIGIEIFVEPFTDDLRAWRDDAFAPVKVEFVASADVSCETGDIGNLITAAGDDVRSPGTFAERLAQRAFLCHGLTVARSSPIRVLTLLEREYPRCFDYAEYVTPVSGGMVKASFSMRLGEQSEVCVAPLGKNPDTNRWEVKGSLEHGLAFCMPHRALSGPRWKQLEDVRLCTTQDLVDHGFDEGLLDKLAYQQAVQRLSR
jgi:hypothetical protein